MADLIDFALPLLVAFGGCLAWRKGSRDNDSSYKGLAVVLWLAAAGGLLAFFQGQRLLD